MEVDTFIPCWTSHKTSRSGSSTLLCEANAMPEGLADAEWVASWFGNVKSLEYDMRKRDTLNRDIQVTTIVTENPDLDIMCVTDAKSLFDNLCREQFSATERGAALEIAVIRDSLESLNGACRWVPHELNPTDPFTKLAGNMTALLRLMKTAWFRLTQEAQEMENRKQFRETTGRWNPRPNVTTLVQSSSITKRKKTDHWTYLEDRNVLRRVIVKP